MAPQSVLFICNMNSVRSPMAACLMASIVRGDMHIDSAGLYPGWRDPFTDTVLSELDMSLGTSQAKTLAAIDLEDFDLVVALTPEVVGEVRRLIPKERLEFWPIDNPSTVAGGEAAVLTAYRSVRDEIAGKIRERFLQTA
ncbi:MAG: low molecular weight phosphatase family protein [Pseudomonadota bacterium]